ncbi:hypothetical protein QTO28_23505 [Streptomyces sp. P9-2B-1]|nr:MULTISPECIES: hypothetical protein [Streptomyces]WJY33804.1 hypothetical protein QTO28_23505 [Streptomyces sp. P9-2B-1]
MVRSASHRASARSHAPSSTGEDSAGAADRTALSSRSRATSRCRSAHARTVARLSHERTRPYGTSGSSTARIIASWTASSASSALDERLRAISSSSSR